MVWPSFFVFNWNLSLINCSVCFLPFSMRWRYRCTMSPSMRVRVIRFCIFTGAIRLLSDQTLYGFPLLDIRFSSLTKFLLKDRALDPMSSWWIAPGLNSECSMLFSRMRSLNTLPTSTTSLKAKSHSNMKTRFLTCPTQPPSDFWERWLVCSSFMSLATALKNPSLSLTTNRPSFSLLNTAGARFSRSYVDWIYQLPYLK